MKLSAPKNLTWLVATVAGVLGIILHWGVIHISALSPYSFLLVAGAFVLLAVATFVRGL